jgi:hypothetical protein
VIPCGQMVLRSLCGTVVGLALTCAASLAIVLVGSCGGRASAPLCERVPDGVQCGGVLCSGATPVCAQVSDVCNLPQMCIAAVDAGAGFPPFFCASTCDTADDCPLGQVCFEEDGKGPGDNGRGCSDSFPPVNSISACQVCRQDCECLKGQCVSGICQCAPYGYGCGEGYPGCM